MIEKNKKGYTLVEIIAVIGILAVITTIFAVNVIKNKNTQKEEEYKNFVNIVKSSADAYISNNKGEIRKLYTIQPTVFISIKDLKTSGYLQGDLKNPKTGSIIKDDEYVKITLGTNKELIITYPTEKKIELNSIVYAYAINNNTNSPRIKVNTNNIPWEYYEILNENNELISSGRIDEAEANVEYTSLTTTTFTSAIISKSGTYTVTLYQYDGESLATSNKVAITVTNTAAPYINLEIENNNSCTPYIKGTTNISTWSHLRVYKDGKYIETITLKQNPTVFQSSTLTQSGTYQIVLYTSQGTILAQSETVIATVNCNQNDTTETYIHTEVINNNTCNPYIIANTSDPWREWRLYRQSTNGDEFIEGMSMPGDRTYSITTKYISKSGNYFISLYEYDNPVPIITSEKMSVNKDCNIIEKPGLVCTPETCEEGCTESECSENEKQGGYDCAGDVWCASEQLQECTTSECYDEWSTIIGSMGVVCETSIGCYDEDSGVIYSGTEDFDDSAYYEENFGDPDDTQGEGSTGDSGKPDWIH